MNLDDVRTIVQAVGERQQERPLLLPGTVGRVEGGGLVEVVMDSDPDGTSIEASCLFADVGEGDRVMVLFDPPRGVFAVGLVGRTVEAGQLVFARRGLVEAEAYTTATTTVVSEDAALSLDAGRFYEFRMSVGVELDTVNTDGVVVSASLYVPAANAIVPANGVVQVSAVWGTVNGALVGGAEGTLHLSRLVLLSEPHYEDVQIRVTARAATGGGDVDVDWEASVWDAGPVSAVQ